MGCLSGVGGYSGLFAVVFIGAALGECGGLRFGELNLFRAAAGVVSDGMESAWREGRMDWSSAASISENLGYCCRYCGMKCVSNHDVSFLNGLCFGI